MPPRALWIVITRPDNLPNALAVAEALREGFPGGAHLVLEWSTWWERARWVNLRERFAAVHAFPRIPACRGLRDLPRLLRQTRARQRALRALPAGPGDLAVCLAGVTRLANAVASAWAAAGRPRPALVVPRKKFVDLCQPVNHRDFRWTTPGWLQNRVVEPGAGLHRTLHLKPRRDPGGDGTRLVRFAAPLAAVFDPVVLLSNTGRELPRNSGPRVSVAPFPNLAELAATLPPPPAGDTGGGAGDRPRVLFFGTPFLLVQNLPPDVYVAHLDRCLDFLRRHYGRDCELIYRPHPGETREAGRLRLEGFRVEEDREVAELLFLRQARRIAAVFSVSSTVSRVALNSGLNAYCLWRCFPFPPTNAAYFETLMGTVPPEFDVRNLDEPPSPYAARRPAAGAAQTFAASLRTALGEPPESPAPRPG